MLTDEARAHGHGAISLRYFNVGGSCGALGEDHEPETHLIPLVLRVAAGRDEHVSVLGTDYPTPDGTAVRDYVHVEDLARAHLLALDRAVGGRHEIYNLGTGSGHSVSEVVGRRAGSPAVRSRSRRSRAHRRSAAAGRRQRPRARSARLAPERTLEDMIRDAWDWHRSHPDGYANPVGVGD